MKFHDNNQNNKQYVRISINISSYLFAYPTGDDLYPKNPVVYDHLTPDEVLSTEETMEEVAKRCQRFHRFEFGTVTDYQLVCNVTVPYGHIGPKEIIVKERFSSHL